MKDIEIRPATDADFEAMCGIYNALVDAGETYPFESGSPKHACYEYWFGEGIISYVAVMARERMLGMYKLVPNVVGRGSHVANASYMVSPAAQGVGIGKLLGEHSLREARDRGFLAMQFNYVVSTNVSAVTLWKKLGFTIVGTLPKAYRHKRLGFVDAYVMYRYLVDPNDWPEASE